MERQWTPWVLGPGTQWGCRDSIMGLGIRENQMEQKLDNEMETGSG